ncbi:MAG: hypothetical protein EA350_03350 [Gemmatimonadales bacterium]|nr:MAG: hypothetical protein EA350_03350 [Gemmatimonadales bacterium]
MPEGSLFFAPLLAVLLALQPTPDSLPAGGDALASASESRGGLPAARDPEALAYPVITPPRIDGILDEAEWSLAEPLRGFVQRVPSDGAPASEPTEVRVLYDAAAIYVGVWLWDSQPDRISEGPAIRDSRLDDSDAVVLVFDTYRDGQNGFVFGTNPSGIEYDGQVTNEGRGGGAAGGGFNLNWDGSWDVATSRDEHGWYAEFRIPFSTLRYDSAAEAVWGLNVMRRLRRLNEESFWAPISRQYSLHRVSQAGVLRGLVPPAGRQATVSPYLLQSAQRDFAAGDLGYGYPFDLGGDAKVQLSQSLTLDLTVNTDFAQVEADDQQVNLSRFSLFFPEKRPFFLENSGYFQVGTGGSELFFSRRIGIAQGRPVPIRGGGRLSGRTGGFNVGLLHIQTGLDTPLAQGEAHGNAFSVARVARELPNRSQVGGFVAERRGRGLDGDVNRTYAVDGQVGLGESLTLSSFAARTGTPGLEGSDHAVHVDALFTTRDYRAMASYREVAGNFNPEVGFVSRRDYRTGSVFGMHYIRPERISWLREIRPHFSYNTFRSLETGFEQSARLHLDSHFEFSSGAHFEPAFNWVREGLVNPFEIVPGVVVEPGTYDGWEAAWRFNTDLSAPLSVRARLDAGHFLSGNRRAVSGELSYRHGSVATLGLRLDHNTVELAGGDFDVTLAAVRAGYFFTPRISLQSLVQYATQQDMWSANLRFGWQHTAGTGLFIVYNDARGIQTFDGPLYRSLIVKYSRQFQLFRG